MDSVGSFVVDELLAAIKDVVKKNIDFKDCCQKLQVTLEGLIPTLEEVAYNQLQDGPQTLLKEFYEKLQFGKELVQKCSKVSHLKFWRIYKYANEIQRLDQDILKFIQTIGWALSFREIHEISHGRASLGAKFDKFEVKIEEIGDKIGNFENSIPESLQRIMKDRMDQLENGKNASPLSIPKLPDFSVGLETSLLSSLTRLKVVRLERVIIPPLQECCQSWPKLEKLSFILCEGFKDMTPLNMGWCLNFPRLLDFTIDHCSDLKELPASMCEMTSLKRLSVTNCHDFHKFLDDIGMLSSLQILRLCGCPSLKEVPDSICKLRQLQFLDISSCYGIKQLPDEIGRLSSLKKLDMRECSHVRQVPGSACHLKPQIQRVICCEQIQRRWSQMIGSGKVEAAEEQFDLDWLDG